MFGLANELMREDGLVWCRRLMMFDQMGSDSGFRELRGRDYGLYPEDAKRAPQRVLDVLALFANQWQAQRALRQ